MSKSPRRPSRTRKKTSPSRSRAKSRRKPASRRGGDVVRLKPLYDQIGSTVDELRKLPPSDRVKFVIERLTQCRDEFGEFCGPTMDIPGDGLPNA